MKRFIKTIFAFSLATAIGSAAGCSSSPEETEAPEEGPAEVSVDDVPDLDDVLADDEDASAAMQVGDPAIVLGRAREITRRTASWTRAVLAHVRDAVGARAPDRHGKTPSGHSYGTWEHAREDGTVLRATVVRLGENRFRVMLGAERDGARRGILTGVFLKAAARKGAGRFHVNLTNASEVLGAPAGVTGVAHILFANGRDDVKARRIRLLDTRWSENSENDEDPANYALDFLRRPGVGGVARVAATGDLVEALEGSEFFGARIAWREGVGGRGDAVLVHLKPEPRSLIGRQRECWGPEGLREAFQDDIAENDEKDGENEGDPSKCHDLVASDPPEDTGAWAATDSGDAEVDAALDEAGATAIEESEAGLEEEIE